MEVAVGAGVDHCFNVAWLGALLDGADTPILYSYARASMMGASRERDCLRVTSIRRGSPRPVVKSWIYCPSVRVIAPDCSVSEYMEVAFASIKSGQRVVGVVVLRELQFVCRGHNVVVCLVVIVSLPPPAGVLWSAMTHVGCELCLCKVDALNGR
jgi:hypothetical protein